jgi:hypothetical protein
MFPTQQVPLPDPLSIEIVGGSGTNWLVVLLPLLIAIAVLVGGAFIQWRLADRQAGDAVRRDLRGARLAAYADLLASTHRLLTAMAIVDPGKSLKEPHESAAFAEYSRFEDARARAIMLADNPHVDELSILTRRLLRAILDAIQPDTTDNDETESEEASVDEAFEFVDSLPVRYLQRMLREMADVA